MRDLMTVAGECLTELDKLGIKYGKITEFRVNTRAKTKWGTCYKDVDQNIFRIDISASLLDESCDLMGLKDTIIHEILHTCKGCLNHGQAWQMLAQKVNEAYGYNIKRVSSPDEKGLIASSPKHPRYAFRCKKCGTVLYRYRKSKFVEHPEKYRCALCRGSFEQIHV